jgi:hypothetical protein
MAYTHPNPVASLGFKWLPADLSLRRPFNRREFSLAPHLTRDKLSLSLEKQ